VAAEAARLASEAAQRKASARAESEATARAAATREAAREAAIRCHQRKTVADNLYRNGQYQRAVAEYGKIINDPRCTVQLKVVTLWNRSSALNELQQYNSVINDCKSVLMLCTPGDTFYGKTHRRLAGMYRNLEQWDSADSHYSACVESTANLVEKFQVLAEQNSCAAEKSRKEFKKKMSEQADEFRKTMREDRAKWEFGGFGGFIGNSNAHHRAVLGVGDKASEGEIKSAYRKQALQFHPDKNRAPGARQRFDEIQAAYNALK